MGYAVRVAYSGPEDPATHARVGTFAFIGPIEDPLEAEHRAQDEERVEVPTGAELFATIVPLIDPSTPPGPFPHLPPPSAKGTEHAR